MKKTIILFLMTLLPMVASAVYINGIYYSLFGNTKTATVTSGPNEYSGDITIPASVTYNNNSYSVTSIGDAAFAGCTNLTSVTIPNSVTSIGNCAFEDCRSLVSIIIPNNVTAIGEFTFSGCRGLISIKIPNSVTEIKIYAFRGCSSLTSITIPNNVTTIGEFTFYGCRSLTSITIPNSVTSIGKYAFYDCSGLTSVTIPNSVTSIRDNAFENCNSLTSVSIPNSVTSIGDHVFSKCNNLTSITIGNNVKSIGDYAFSVCSGLTSITIPNSVTTLGDYAFVDCRKLNSIMIGNSVKSIGLATFFMCSALTSITIPNSVMSIGHGAFQGCSSLISITIGNSVKTIGTYAFSGCSSLTSITIPNSVMSIEQGAFSDCSGLTTVLIPNNVINIGESAFAGCSGLSSIKVDGGNTVYDSRNDCNAIIETESNSLVTGCQNTIIPNSVTSIGKHAFSGCCGLTSITIGSSVKSIGNHAFESCSGLTSITIPNSVTSIGKYAFFACEGLTSVHISDIVTWCNIDFEDAVANPLYFARHLFINENVVNNLVIPNSIKSIMHYAFYRCNSLISIKIPSSVTSIGTSAFASCSSLSSVEIPNSVTSIGDEAFYNCSGLTSVIIPNSVTLIGNYALYCKNLKTVYSEIESPFSINENVFTEQTYAGTLHVPANTKAEYLQTSGWNKFTNIVEPEPTTYSLSITATGNGNASYNGTNIRNRTSNFTVNEGVSATITLTPDNGYRIKSVKVNGTTVNVTNNQYTISNISTNTTVSVEFEEIEVTTLTVDGVNYSVVQQSNRTVKVDKGDYGQMLTVPATVTSGGATWTVIGIDNNALKDNKNLAAIIWNPYAAFTATVSNPNLLLYVKAAQYAPAAIKNVVVNGTATNITLVDAASGNDFYCPQAFTARSISYQHNYSMKTGIDESRGWETIALPFDVQNIRHSSKGNITPFANRTTSDSRKPFWLYELTGNGFVRTGSIKAYTPYIISMPNNSFYDDEWLLNGSVTFSATNVTVGKTENIKTPRYDDRTFIPNFADKGANDGLFALNVNNSYASNSSGMTEGSKFVLNMRPIHPFEAYMTSTSNTRQTIDVFEDMTTDVKGVYDLQADWLRKEAPLFDLQGRKVNGTKKGVYIRNRQKIIIK